MSRTVLCRLGLSIALAISAQFLTVAVASATAGTLTEFPLPLHDSFCSCPLSIALGPDGNLWFTEPGGGLGNGAIGKITTAGVITEYTLPNANSGPGDIAAGPSGSGLWFTEQGGNRIGRITTDGVITEFPIRVGFSNPTGIALGSDGNMWFTQIVGPTGPEAPARPLIGRITPNGLIREFPIHVANSMPASITSGPDGNLWFTDEGTNGVGRVSITTGQVTEFPHLTPGPNGITTGPDGNLWVTETAASKVARLTTTGTVAEFPTPSAAPTGIVTGPDRNLWLTEVGGATGSAIATMAATGSVVANYSLGTTDKAPAGITVGPDSRLWFTEVMGGTTTNGFDGAIGAITAF